MSAPLAVLRGLCLVGAVICAPVHAAGAQVPWADPIGSSRQFGTAPGASSVPWADPIGASRLNPPNVQQPLYRQRRPQQRQLPRQRCYRAVDVSGQIVTRCTTVR